MKIKIGDPSHANFTAFSSTVKFDVYKQREPGSLNGIV